MSKDDKIKAAAKMAGDWWAERLDDKHADRREAFSKALSKVVKKLMRGEIKWDRRFEQRPGYTVLTSFEAPGDGKALDRLYIGFDYDPDCALETALQEVFGPGLKVYELGKMLPQKHELAINLKDMVLEPKEGYGNWTAKIPVRA